MKNPDGSNMTYNDLVEYAQSLGIDATPEAIDNKIEALQLEAQLYQSLKRMLDLVRKTEQDLEEMSNE